MSLSVAIFADHFPELTETFVSAEVRELARQGHDVCVEATARAGRPDPSAAEGLDVRYRRHRADGRALAWLVARHPVRVAADLLARRRWRREEHVAPLRCLAPVARRMVRERRGHLHAHFAAGAALDAMRISMLTGIPYSVMTHGYDIFQRPMNLREKHDRAAFAVTACEYSARHLRDAVGAPRVHRLVVGVDGERFRRTRPHPQARRVIAIARLVEKKGLSHLLDAAALLEDRGRPLDDLVIVGDGPLRGELEARGIGRFLGARSPRETRDLLEDAAVLAMPCVVAADGDRDTMPVVVKEALAMEVPVVASDEVGLPEVVREEWGLLVAPGDAAALADALETLFAMPARTRAAMGRAGRAFVLEACSLQGETARLAQLIAAV